MNDTVVYTRVTRVRPDGGTEEAETCLLSEHELESCADGETLAKLVCTACDLRELAAGWLFSAGILRSAEEIESIALEKDGGKISFALKKPDAGKDRGAEKQGRNRRDDRSGAPSGLTSFTSETVFSLAEAFREETALHAASQGTHSCMLLRDGEIVYRSEDIGRHNAVDKVIGAALLREIPPEECVLFTSGRVPKDMVQKVVRAGIPVLAAKSVTTAEAVEYARKKGLILIWRAWPDQYETGL